MQDHVDYFTRTHHSHLGTYDYSKRDDLVQALVELEGRLSFNQLYSRHKFTEIVRGTLVTEPIH